MNRPAPVVALHKLGVARKVARSRIWLEGKRVAAAGFTHGTPYRTWFAHGGLHLSTAVGLLREGSIVRTVAGTPDRPIIDITGTAVFDAFGSGSDSTHVRVTYAQGVITITKAGA